MARRGPITLVVLACAAALAAPASGADIPVTTTADALATDGACSLREAVTAANADTATGGCPAGAGADRVLVPAGTYTLTRHGAGEDANATGDLDVTGPLTLSGPGTLDGDGADRVLDGRTAAASLVLEGVTVQGGRTPDGPAGLSALGNPGADATGVNGSDGEPGGGVRAVGPLALRDCRIAGNRTGGGGAGGDGSGGGSPTGSGGFGFGGNGGNGGRGGGVAAIGTLTVERCTFTGNHTGSGAKGGDAFGGSAGGSEAGGPAQAGIGGSGGFGGGLWAAGPLSVVDSTFAGNGTGDGAAGGNATGGSGGNGAGSNPGGPGGFAFGGFGGFGGDGGGAAHQGSLAPEDAASVQRSTFTANTGGAGAGGGSAFGGIGGTGGPTNGTGGPGGEARGGWGRSGFAAGFATANAAAIENVTFDANTVPAGAPGGASFGGVGGHGLGTGDGGPGGIARGSHGGDGGYGGAFEGPDLRAAHTTFSGTVVGGPGDAGSVVAGHGGAPGQTGGSQGAAGTAVAGPAGNPATGRHVGAGTAVLRASIFGAGTARGCDGAQSIVDAGGNLATADPSCPGGNGDPRLGPLADNGGPTRTMALLEGSAARNVVPAAACSPFDQRGIPRPIGAACDAGAYEATPPDVVTGAAGQTTATAATVAGLVTANALTATSRVEFGRSIAYGSATPDAPVPGNRSPFAFTVRLTGLRPGTTYHYRVVARNADGTTAGADATFTTTAGRADRKPPKLSRVSLKRRRLRFTLSEPATVVVRAQRCRKAGHCTVLRKRTLAAKAGRSTRKLRGRFLKRANRLVLRPTDAAGNRGKPLHLRVR